MTKKPLLTAIIFTYNHATAIKRCIKSLIKQKTKYEYIIKIYDDCSTDGTSDICARYAKRYPDLIKHIRQKENTFLLPYNQMQSFKAVQEVDTKYWCYVDGDDCWYGKDKIELALDFLEKHPFYAGWGSDTRQIKEYSGEDESYIHDVLKWEIKDKIKFDINSPFLMAGARIFRNIGFKKLKMLPVDYIMYWWHLSKGPIHYHDEITSVYVMGKNSCFANLPNIPDLCSMFAYRLAKAFKYRHNKFCVQFQKKYDNLCCSGDERYERLCKLQRKYFYNRKKAWEKFFEREFYPKYTEEYKDVNFVFPRELAKQSADARGKG